MLIFQVDLGVNNDVVDGTLTIYTSFENVSYDHLPLRPGQKKLGQDLYEAGHIQCVKEVRKPGKTPEITGYCIRQASVTESAFRVTIQLDNERKVTSLDCNCDGGPEGSAGCKHWYALLYYLNNFVDESKTDAACEWIEPSKMGKKKYPKGLPLEVIARIPDKYKCPPVSFKCPSDEKMEEQAKIFEECGNTEGPLYKIYKLRPKDSSKVPKKMPDLPDWVKKKVFRKCLMPSSVLRKPKTVKEQFYYDEHIALQGPDQSFKLCSQTVGQGKCAKWKEARGPLVTGSTGYKILHAQEEHTRLGYFHKTAKIDHLYQIKYGIANEDPAIALFCELKGYQVLKVGLVVPDKFWWLGVSPDGLIWKDDRPGFGILEVKCIASCEDEEIYGVAQCDEDCEQLKNTSDWYMQIQLTAWATKADYAILFLYSGKESDGGDSKCIEVGLKPEWA